MKQFSRTLLLAFVLLLVLAVCLASCTDQGKDPESTTAGSTDTGETTGTDATGEVTTNKETKTDDTKSEESSAEETTEEPKPSSYIAISSAKDLADAAAKIAKDEDGYASKTFKLTADITLDGDFTPISGFKGVFDGQFHKITGLNVDADGAAVGLFDTLDGATVTNLVIEDAKVANATPDCKLGIIAGQAVNAKISYITVSGTLTLGGNSAVAGGLVGSATGSSLTNVKAVVTVSGAGAQAGGLVGLLGEKSVLVNGYADAAINASAAVKASAVASKVQDSAIAYVLVKDGEIVANAAGNAWTASYVIACKSGVSASEMGWNTVDWDVSGEVPAIKTDLDKQHSAPTVTVNGIKVNAVFGEKLPDALPALNVTEDSIELGYLLAGDGFYADLPILNDAEITVDTYSFVFYSLLGGKNGFVPCDAAGKNLVIGKECKLGDVKLTVLGAKTYEADFGDLTYTVTDFFLTDEAGNVYLLTVEEKGGKQTFVVLKNVNTDQSVSFMLPMVVGAWEENGVVMIASAELFAKDGKNVYRVYEQKSGKYTDVQAYLTVDGGDLVLGFGSYHLAYRGENVVVVGNGKDYAPTLAVFEGEWANANGDILKVSDGKVGTNALTAGLTAIGIGASYTDGGKVYTLTADIKGILVSVDGAEPVLYASNDFGGTYTAVKGGVAVTIRIVGTNVWFEGYDEPVSGTLGFTDGKSVLTLTVNGATYHLTKDGTNLSDNGNGLTFFAADTVAKLLGTHVLGTVRFVYENGNVVLGDQKYAADLTVENGNTVLKAGDFTFTLDVSGKVVLTGYTSPITGSSDALTLFTPAEVTVFLGSLPSEYVSLGYGISYPAITVRVKGNALTVDGVAYDYELYEDAEKIGFRILYKAEKEDKLVRIVPDTLYATVYGDSWGNMMTGTLADAVGKYYEFLVGENSEDAPAPKTVEFTYNSNLIVGGKTYTAEEYGISIENGSVIFSVRGEESITVTFKNKTATVSGESTVYVNYDRILKAGNSYVLPGSADGEMIEVIKGQMGYMDEDEDGEEEWVDAIFPLFGFRYTVGSTVYTSESFTWARNADGSAVVTVLAKSKDGTEKTFVLTYDDLTRSERITLTVDNRTVVLYESETLSKAAGSYKNANATFAFDKSGAFTVNGVRINAEATFDFANGVFTFKANGKTYTITTTRHEIAHCGDEVFYDASLYHFAGIELVAFGTEGIGKFQPKYRLKLTDQGLTFNGELVTWGNYGKWFTVHMDGEEITWDGFSVYSFTIQLYPHAELDPEEGESGWAHRSFVPLALYECTDGFFSVPGTGSSKNVFGIITPADGGTKATGFTLSFNATVYDYDEYEFSMDGNTLVVTLADGKVLRFTSADSKTIITVNGATATEFAPPALDDFVMADQSVLGIDRGDNNLTIRKNDDDTFTWIYGTSFTKTGSQFTYGEWNGKKIVYVQPYSYISIVLLPVDGKVYPVNLDLYKMAVSALKDNTGKDVTFSFKAVDNALTLAVRVGTADAEDVTIGHANYVNNDNYTYVSYTINGQKFVIALNADQTTAENYPAIVLTADEFNLCFKVDLDSATLYGVPSYDAKTGAGTVNLIFKARYGTATLTNESLALVDGYDFLYRYAYTVVNGSDSTDHVCYIAIFKKNAAYGKAMMALTEKEFAYLGKHTDGNVNIDVTIEVDQNGAAQYVVRCGDETVTGTMGYAGKDFQFKLANGDMYVMSVMDGKAVLKKIAQSQYRYVTGNSSYSLVGSYTYSASVTFEDGGYKVKYGSSYDKVDATDVSFGPDDAYIQFTANGIVYRLCWLEDTGYYHAYVVEASKHAFSGTHNFGEDTLIVGFQKPFYSWSFVIKYNGTDASNVQFPAENLMTFEVSNKVYVAELTEKGVILAKDVADLNADEYKAFMELRGNYNAVKDNATVAKVVFGYRVSGTNGKYTLTLITTYDGKDATYAVDAATGTLSLTCDGVTKHYVRYQTSALVELSDSEYAKLGTNTVDGHEITVTVSVSYSSRNEKYTVSFSYKVDGASASATNKTAGDVAFTQFKVGDVYYFYMINGDAKSLYQLTADEVVILNLSSKSIKIGDASYTIKGVVGYADGKYTFQYTFGTGTDDAVVTTTALTEGNGFSFVFDGATYYYLIGSSSYLVNADDFAIYGELKVGDVTLKFTWGSSQLMVAMKDGDAFGSAVKAEKKSDGTHDYYQFTLDGKSWILAKNSAGEWVLTDASAIGANLKHFKNFQYQTSKVMDLSNNVVFATVSGMYIIKDDGTPAFALKFGDLVLTDYEEICDGEVFKVTIEGKVRYFAMATNYAPSSRWYWEDYALFELSEAQAAFMGKTVTVDGVCFTILGKCDYSKKCSVLVYVGTESTPWTSNTTAAFTENGTLTFTYNGVNYVATVTDGVLTVTAAN